MSLRSCGLRLLTISHRQIFCGWGHGFDDSTAELCDLQPGLSGAKSGRIPGADPGCRCAQAGLRWIAGLLSERLKFPQ
jgi:hypothetical protein